jgi:SAM-dependent methyltransferase
MSAPRIFTPEYYDRMRELERESWWSAAMRDVAGRLLERARLPEQGRLLDLGCGSGQTMSWLLTRYPDWQTVGIDLSLDAAKAAQSLRPGEVALASALALPFRDQSLDLIVTLDVLQHLPLDGGDRRAMGEIRRVLKPGGFVLIRTNSQSFPKADDDPVHLFHRYRASELRAKLQAAGFIVRRMGRLNALLGLAEIPRELRARRTEQTGYHGLMATARREARWVSATKRRWLRWEGHFVTGGIPLPFGRTILALCQTPPSSRGY